MRPFSANQPTKPRAYSYVRFSTPEQAEGNSLERQTSRSEAYARQHGLQLDQTLTFRDLGVSGFKGKNLTGGELGAFLRAIETGQVPSTSTTVEFRLSSEKKVSDLYQSLRQAWITAMP